MEKEKPVNENPVGAHQKEPEASREKKISPDKVNPEGKTAQKIETPNNDKKDSGTTINTNVEKSEGTIQAAEKIFNNKIKQLIIGDENRIEIKQFSISDAFPVKKESLAELQHTFVYPESHLDVMKKILKKWRMLLISGEKSSGKFLTAQFLSLHLMNFKGSEELKFYYVEPLAREIDINIIGLIRESSEFSDKVLVFKNSLLKNNPGLIEFFNSSSGITLEFLSQRLAEMKAYLIFTTDDETLRENDFSIDKLPFREVVSPLDQNLLKEGMEKKLKQYCTLNPQIDTNKALQFIDKENKSILQHLKKMSLINIFIEEYLEKILNNQKTLEDSVVEVNHIGKRLEQWFLKDLCQEKRYFEIWTFALCLAIFNHSKYTDFYDIHREITQHLLQQFDPFKTYDSFVYTFSESQLLSRCQAQIAKDILTYSDIVSFGDENYQIQLLDILIKNNRNVLLSILPMLKEYVETHSHLYRRRFAAIGLGRIGVIDPVSITLGLMNRWSSIEDNRIRANVGYLFEGIISSGDPIYISLCMGKLKQMALGMDINQQWTAIAAYKLIGFHDLDIAMNELRIVQEEIVGHLFKKQSLLDFLYSQTQLLDEQGVLASLDRIYEETKYLLSTVRYSIVALSIVGDPLDVLDKMRVWINKGNGNTRINVVLFCMGNGGIFKELESRHIVFVEKEKVNQKKKESTNPILFALTTGNEGINKMVAFLRDLYLICFSEFKRDIKKPFKELLFEHLRLWAVKSLPNPRSVKALQTLLLEFYKSGDRDLKNSLWDHMNRWQAPKGKDKPLKELINQVSKQFFTSKIRN